ncbi:MAG: archease [Thermoleophilia bacterium]|nr:archease [Thermoleophilia bacterium]
MEACRRWTPADRAAAYRVLDHPADLWLEVFGAGLPQLLEHGLVALYDNLVALSAVQPTVSRTIAAQGATAADALRALLAEALFLFDTEGFLAAGARVTVAEGVPIAVRAELCGEPLDRDRHELLAEVKAVTYHRLLAEARPDGSWRATVLLDV